MIQETVADRIRAVGNEAVTAALKENKLKLVRHTPSNRITRNDLLYDNRKLELFTSEQTRNIFLNVRYVFCFLAEEGVTCGFLRAYEVCGLLNKDEFADKFPTVSYNPNYFYYNLITLSDFDDYWNRLVISWGNSARSWHQRKLDKEVFCMRPRGYIRDMPRWNRITLDFLELRTLFLHSSSNPMWKDYLSNHDGVYLIRHKATNKMYVGSAYGDEGGIWGRWNGYVDTHHNNNKGIQNFLLTDENSINDFTFSLLEVFPKGATKAIVISAESFHKDRLGTRDFGLNRN